MHTETRVQQQQLHSRRLSPVATSEGVCLSGRQGVRWGGPSGSGSKLHWEGSNCCCLRSCVQTVSRKQATGQPIRRLISLQPNWFSIRLEAELWRLVFPAKVKEAHLKHIVYLNFRQYVTKSIIFNYKTPWTSSFFCCFLFFFYKISAGKNVNNNAIIWS